MEYENPEDNPMVESDKDEPILYSDEDRKENVEENKIVKDFCFYLQKNKA
ncbi:hypothetical protein RhiirA5_434653 [Rhizophagus irregularis]|uniref:Uncharacterized protein n=1 Tax=Rhizophagus irregularis TaxID=588596 RepID=A0A2N0NPQ0_9GLOM|nr:hypothetical protein RhiirA5_434653 [Rhizophagus irregularis]